MQFFSIRIKVQPSAAVPKRGDGGDLRDPAIPLGRHTRANQLGSSQSQPLRPSQVRPLPQDWLLRFGLLHGRPRTFYFCSYSIILRVNLNIKCSLLTAKILLIVLRFRVMMRKVDLPFRARDDQTAFLKPMFYLFMGSKASNNNKLS